MATLKQIAQLVGVSVSTVSRVINNDTRKHISEDTRRKVWEAARQLNYNPSHSPRQLVHNKMLQEETGKKIGCILSLPNNKYNHPYFSPMLSGIEDKLQAMGSTLLFIRTEEEVLNEWKQKTLFAEGQPDGLIFIENVNPSLYQALKSLIPACVGIDVSDPTIPVIAYDRIIAAKAAAKHLIDQGHRKIGFIGGAGFTGSIEQEQRYQGYIEALLDHELELNPNWIIDADWNVDQSYAYMSSMLAEQIANRPTAMFCASDMMAISAMRAVSESGLRVPQDIAFIGLDNIEVSKYTSPPLSSIHIPKYEMGAVAAKTVIDTIEGSYPLPFKLLLPFELMVRQSSDYSI